MSIEQNMDSKKERQETRLSLMFLKWCTSLSFYFSDLEMQNIVCLYVNATFLADDESTLI